VAVFQLSVSVSRYWLAAPTGRRGRSLLRWISGLGRSRCFARVLFAAQAEIALFDLGAAPVGMVEDDAFEDVEQLLRLRMAVDKGDKQFFVEPEV
jgi:hypothetical protein